MILTLPLFVIIIAFIVYENVAHFVYHNRNMKTASSLIRTWEGRSLLRKSVTTAALVVLYLHLVLMLF